MKKAALLLVLSLGILTTAYSQTILYVDATASGANNGSSWANAYTTVQAAINVSNTGDEIHIATGTYKQGTELVINTPLTLKGGYPSGGGTQDIANNPTILDGNNTHRVLKAIHTTGTLTLQGLTIQNGKVSVSSGNAEGGGIYTTGDIVLSHCHITSNKASSTATLSSSTSYGGGIYTNSGSITLNNSGVTDNTASSTSTATSSTSSGGGIYTNSGSITLTNSRVADNITSSTATSFSSSSISYGGGIYTNSSSITLTNSQVSHNTASSTASLSSISYGGGIYTNSSSITLTNSQVSHNTASSTSSTSSTSGGGGIYGITTLQNSIVWGNKKSTNGGANYTPNEHENGTLTTNHSLIKGQDLSATNGMNATGSGFDPLFVDEANGDFRLQVGSPLINAGNNTYLPQDVHDLDGDGNTTEQIPYDLAGNSRVFDGTVDVGPYEYQPILYPTAGIIYVKKGGAGAKDGSSWANALPEVADALSWAGDQDVTAANPLSIYIAAGTYKPLYKAGDGTTDRDKAFVLVDKVKVYGGFAGTEATLADRDLSNTANASILSGDFNDDDVITGSGASLSITANTENAYHVVISVSDNTETILDGFTISGGNANGNGTIGVHTNSLHQNAGGGMFNASSSPTITNCTFSKNTATNNGGGMYNNNFTSSPTITNCTFSKNIATNNGGGMYSDFSSPAITNCIITTNTALRGGGLASNNSSQKITNTTISKNTATNNGGGMYHDDSFPTMTNCTISENTATNAGGGIYNAYSSPIIINSIIATNTAATGGGLHNTNSSPTITNTTISENTATNTGGGIYNDDSSPTITISTINGNTATGTGGGLYNNANSSPIITNSIIATNTAATGGGMHSTNSSPTITNSTISENAATNTGGGMYNTNSSPTITNTIFWGNEKSGNATVAGADIVNVSSSASTITHSIVQLDITAYTTTNNNAITAGTGNIYKQDPFFIGAGDFSLQVGSPAINAGDNSNIPADTQDLDGDGITTEQIPYDLAGNSRVYDGMVDIGAYENTIGEPMPTNDILYVKKGGAGAKDGSSWANALSEVADALLWAKNQDVTANPLSIYVAAGIYKPLYKAGDGTTDRDKALVLVDSVKVYGGFAGTEATLADRDLSNTANASILSGDFNDDDAITGSGASLSITGNTENAYHVVISVSDSTETVLDGFTISGGNANGNSRINVNTNELNNLNGGGMYNVSSSPTITDCIFSENTANDGGGMYNEASSPTITNCTFSKNTATREGGGIYNRSASQLKITNSTFSENTATSQGGGLYNDASSATITNSTFSKNTANDGGGMFNGIFSQTIITNSTFSENTATRWGGGMYNDSYLTITNSTFSKNTATNYGGGMYNHTATSPTITNCIFSENTGGHGGGMYNHSSFPTITDCIFSKNESGFGGGMHNTHQSSPIITNSTFNENTANDGGGMYSVISSPIVTNCTFSENTSIHGGGMYNRNFTSFPTITNCIFSGNRATSRGGGMYNYDSSPTITNCTIRENTASNDGGGIYNTTRSAPLTITNSIITTNTALRGGGMYNDASSPTIIANSIISGNTANDGGGVYNQTSPLNITSCTISENTATNDGGGIYNQNIASPSPTITNSILWGNEKNGNTNVAGADIVNASTSSSPSITHSIVQLDSTAYTSSTNNAITAGTVNIYNQNPLFTDAVNSDFSLQAGSPAINAGDNTYLPQDAGDLDGDGNTTEQTPYDLAGNARVHDIKIDMGAYENQVCPSRIYVDTTKSYGGRSWAYAYKTLEEALNSGCSTSIDTVYVAKGSYAPLTTDRAFRYDFSGKNLVIMGGYSTGGTVQDPILYPTIISGDIGIQNDNSDNLYHAFYATGNGSVTLQDLTITGGKADGTAEHEKGAGIYADTQVTLKNVTIEGNTGNDAESRAIYVSPLGTVTIKQVVSIRD